ncbi:MAG TPA: 50S ribosomal protein L6 [Polyangiaceae bacterium]|nr:50S ribosomal protein L6 [Polyangiaceae bacterium]
MSEQTQQAAPKRLSRVGKRPVVLPKGVAVNVAGTRLEIQGPKGKLAMDLPPNVSVKKDGDKVLLESDAEGRDAARLQGLARALLASRVKGAAEGYERQLELVGTGYRAEVKGQVVTLSLGFSHPTQIQLPAGVTGNVPPDSKGTMLVLNSADKAALGQIAATIRDLRPPEPYGGKGIRYRGETIRRKAGKAAKGKGK